MLVDEGQHLRFLPWPLSRCAKHSNVCVYSPGVEPFEVGAYAHRLRVRASQAVKLLLPIRSSEFRASLSSTPAALCMRTSPIGRNEDLTDVATVTTTVISADVVKSPSAVGWILWRTRILCLRLAPWLMAGDEGAGENYSKEFVRLAVLALSQRSHPLCFWCTVTSVYQGEKCKPSISPKLGSGDKSASTVEVGRTRAG